MTSGKLVDGDETGFDLASEERFKRLSSVSSEGRVGAQDMYVEQQRDDSMSKRLRQAVDESTTETETETESEDATTDETTDGSTTDDDGTAAEGEETGEAEEEVPEEPQLTLQERYLLTMKNFDYFEKGFQGD